MKFKFILTLFLVTANAFVASMGRSNTLSSPKEEIVEQETSKLLESYGFSSEYKVSIQKSLNDLTEKIKKQEPVQTSKGDTTKKSVTEMSAKEQQLLNKQIPILNYSIERFEIFEVSRDIAAFVFAHWSQRSDKERFQDIQELLLKLSVHKIISPSRLGAEPGLDASTALENAVKSAVVEETKSIFRDILLAGFGKDKSIQLLNNDSQFEDLSKIFEKVSKYNKIRYNHLEVSQTPYLGKALLVAILNDYILTSNKKELEALNKSFLSTIQLNAFEFLKGKINNNLLKPFDIVATSSPRLSRYFKEMGQSEKKLSALFPDYIVKKGVNLDVYNEFGSVYCLPSAELCNNKDKNTLSINWIVEGPILPNGGLRFVDIQGFAPHGYVPSFLYFHAKDDYLVKQWQKEKANGEKSIENYRPVNISDLISGSYVDLTSLDSLTSLEIALSLSPAPIKVKDLKKITEEDVNINEDISQRVLDSSVVHLALTSSTWVSIENMLVSDKFIRPMVREMKVSKETLELLASTPAIKPMFETIDNLSKANKETKRESIICVSQPQEPESNEVKQFRLAQESPENLKEFLYQIGFGGQSPLEGSESNRSWKSHTEIMKEYLDKKITYNTMTRNQQVRNIEDYRKVESSVNLALFISRTLSECEYSNKFMDQMSAFIGLLMAYEAPNAFNSNVLLSNGKVEYKSYKAALSEKMASETEKLVQLILDSVYGSRISHLTNSEQKFVLDTVVPLSQDVVELAFMNHQIGKSRFLGRALMALFLRSAYLHGNYEFAYKNLSKVLNDYNLPIENFIGNTWSIRSDDAPGKTVQIPVYNMSYVYTRSISMESPTIPSGAIPGGGTKSVNGQLSTPYLNGKKMGLVGSFLALMNLPGDGVSYNKSESEKDKNFFHQFNDGFSHIGYAVIREVILNNHKQESFNLKMSWMIDNYPAPVADSDDDYTKENEELRNAPYNPGGIRFSGLEQYYRVDHHSRIGIVNMVNMRSPQDPSLADKGGNLKNKDYFQFFEYAKRQVRDYVNYNYRFYHYGNKPSGDLTDKVNANISGNGPEFLDQGKALNFNERYPEFKMWSPELSETGKPYTLSEFQEVRKTNNSNTSTEIQFQEDPWTIEISPSEFEKMNSEVFKSVENGINPDAQTVKIWYDRVNSHSLNKLMDLMYKGVTFIWITPYGQYFKGGAYCSSTGILSWKMGTGLDLQEVKDTYHPIVQRVSEMKDQKKSIERLLNMEIGSVEQIDNIAMMWKMPIIAPSGLGAQVYNRPQDAKLIVPIHEMPLNRSRRQFGREFQIQVSENVKDLVGTYSDSIQKYFYNKKLDPTEVQANLLDVEHLEEATLGCTTADADCSEK